MHLKAVIRLAIKTIIGTYQSVLKWSHDYNDFSASWLMCDEWRVIEAWSVTDEGKLYEVSNDDSEKNALWKNVIKI